MAETKGLRSAYAVAQLLSSLEIGGVEDRLNALRSLRLEVIDTAEGPMPKNTARVLLQIMKEPGAGLRRPAPPAGAGPRLPDDRLGQAAHRPPPARAVPPAGDARGVEPDRLRRPCARRQHQGPQVLHPPASWMPGSRASAGCGSSTTTSSSRASPPSCSKPRKHPRHRRAHRHRVLRPLPRQVRAAHLGAPRVRRRPGVPVLPGRAAGDATSWRPGAGPPATSRST
ncbi:MAG: hypothetical protein MZV70_05135 [Desulfobacterales bacterium]|nr:hypothetical protein [Desulfobacterales bacterium]